MDKQNVKTRAAHRNASAGAHLLCGNERIALQERMTSRKATFKPSKLTRI
jgi:hypothetical protein